MKTKKKKKIVFVCTGNTCRSPIAEYLFRQRAEALGLNKLEVLSAGLKASVGSPMNEKSAQLLMDKGFQPLSFASRQIDEKMLAESLAIVCMTDVQRDLLMEMRWKVLREAGEENIENNVYSFSEITGYEILDPYGKDMDCYRYIFELIDGGMSALIEKILPPKVRETFVEKPKTPKKPRASSAMTKKKTTKKTSTKTTTTKKNSTKKTTSKKPRKSTSTPLK